MKRLTLIITVLALTVSMLAGCAKSDGENYDLDYYKNKTGVDGEEYITSDPTDTEEDTSGEYEIITETKPEEIADDSENNEDGGKMITADTEKTEDSGKKITADTPKTETGKGNYVTAEDDKSPLSTPTEEEIKEEKAEQSDNLISDDIDSDERPKSDSNPEYDDTESTRELTYHDWVDAKIGSVRISESDFNTELLQLPKIEINTLDGQDVTSKSEYKSALITISNTDNKYCIEKNQVEIRGRGNSTWMYFDKKPYKLKFGSKTDLFGMGASKKYVLLANALDETAMRTYMAFYLAKEFDIRYSTDFELVNVFINGDYKGMYILCEQVSEGAARVNINTSKTGLVDTGYLLESLNGNEGTEYKTFTLPSVNGKHLGDESRHQFIVKSPGADITARQLEYITDYVTQVNEAIFEQDWTEIKKLIDVDSFVNMTLVNALMMNNDYGYSFYMYKEQNGKLCLGPAWDFDQSSGSSTHGGTTYRGWFAGTEHDWQTALIEIPEFKRLLSERYKEKKGTVDGIVTVMEDTINKYEFDFAMNNLQRNNLFALPDRWRINKSVAKLETYKEQVSFLKTWFMNRIIWLDDQLL